MQQQVQFQAQQPAARAPGQPRPRFAQQTQKACGILQIVLGVYMFFIGIASIVLKAGIVWLAGAGIWSAIFPIIAGSLGVVSARNERTCPIVGCMVMSIFSSLFAFDFFCLSATACGLDAGFVYSWYAGHYNMFTSYTSFIYPSNPEAALAVDCLGILVGLAVFVVAIVQSAVCCRTTCCAPRPAAPTVAYVQQPYTGHATGATVVTVSPGGVGRAGPAMMQPTVVVQPQQQQQPVMGATGMRPPYAYAASPTPVGLPPQKVGNF